ncbi:MAG: cysteine hydrolase [Chloroflexota bacterium]
METNIDPKKTALLVIDMQNDLVATQEKPHDVLTNIVRERGVIANIARVAAAARKAGVLVVIVAQPHKEDYSEFTPPITDEPCPWLSPLPRKRLVEGTPGAEVIAELQPVPGDCFVRKYRRNTFYGTNLEPILRGRGIDTVIISGVLTNGCVAASVGGARERDFQVVVLSDGCAAVDPEAHEFYFKKVFPFTGRVRTAAEVVAAIAGVA